MQQQPLHPRKIINSDHGKLVSCNCIVASVSSKYSLRTQVDNSYNTVFFGISGVVISGTCVGTYAPSNYIMSPNYPQDYGYNVDCRWLISVPGIKNFKLTLLDFEIGSSHSLNVYEGQNVHGDLIKTYSGSYPSPTVLSGNKMYLRFTSDNSTANRGFKIAVSGKYKYYSKDSKQ